MDDETYAYTDKRSNAILNELMTAYAHQVSLLLDTIAEENCMHHASKEAMGCPEDWKYAWPISHHCQAQDWNIKVRCYGRIVFVHVKEKDLLMDWYERLEKLSPPACPAECPELMSPVSHWNQVIDVDF